MTSQLLHIFPSKKKSRMEKRDNQPKYTKKPNIDLWTKKSIVEKEFS